METTAFEDAGKSEGLEIWRIENFVPVPVDVKEHGKFYEGDSYVLLRTYQRKDDFKWNIHFWLGRETTSDESGAAAILAVALDDTLGGAPVQYREVQEHESQLFLSYFPSGVRYLPGGVKSGFSHVDPNEPDPNEPKKLYQVKGKRNVRVRQVQVGIESMNNGDCFILDTGKNIYVYHGSKSKKTERLKAINAGNQIRDQDHAGRPTVKILDEFSSQEELEEFFEELGSGSPDSVPDESSAENDEKFETNYDNKVSLYKVSDSSGGLQVEKLSEKPLSRSMLQSEDCFILDTVTSGIFAWIGKGSTKQEKEEVIKKSEEFITQKNYPRWTRITRVVEGGEPSTFKEYFSSWPEDERKFDVANFGIDVEESRIREIVKNSGTAVTFCPDDGDGSVEIFRIENFEPVPVEEDKFGMFFGGDSYVIKYTTTNNRTIIYYWLGRESSQDEKASAAMQAVVMDGEMDGAAVVIRVVQGFEPNHFNKIFKGKMVIFSGGHASGFKNIKDNDTYDTDGTRLFRVRGTCSEDVRAVQMPEKASSLNSDDVFLLETPDQIYLWFGKNCSEFERDMGKNLPLILSFEAEPVELEEGEEPEAFFEALGGKTEYPEQAEGGPILSPKLYHFSAEKSTDEIFDFKREDLESEDVFVLRFGEEVYIWIGRGTTEKERTAAKEYYMYDDCGLCFLIYEGSEPERFKTFFPDWSV
ncbi:UNVERIFIED_CONTAM: hypothetical protein PYX00_003387 [Menopon gallinae]|uniref:Gelsolin-like domain-containing protein n=1 Tax=Menopon gallinae TaxID=328185 RepID=A0AAW2I258_9NEOP